MANQFASSDAHLTRVMSVVWKTSKQLTSSFFIANSIKTPVPVVYIPLEVAKLVAGGSIIWLRVHDMVILEDCRLVPDY